MNQPRNEKGQFMSYSKDEDIVGEEDFMSMNPEGYEHDFAEEEIRVNVHLGDMENDLIDTKYTTLATAMPIEMKGIYLKGYGTVFGGPYCKRLKGLKGIKLAPEVPGDADYEMKIKDFGTPSVEEMTKAILIGLKFLQDEGAFYVGCMMGQGRTGTYLACFLKAFGYHNAEAVDPIKTVRLMYNKHAVETKAQEDFVRDFPVEKFEYLIQFMKK